MFKTIQKEKIFFVPQPDHAQVAGYLAAHWGNEEFNAPGYYFDTNHPKRLNDEVVLAVAEHDNGWWEWEATPNVGEQDGLPLGLTEVLKNPQEGMDRWRLGVRRFRQKHPYASLIISFHAYWLYAHNKLGESNQAFIHPLYWKGTFKELTFTKEERNNALAFIAEIEELQGELIARVKEDPDCADWVEEKHLKPHARFLQLMDGLSISLCSDLIPPRKGEAKGLGEHEFDLLEVPRKNWEDRVTITVKPLGERRIVCDPFPFDRDPLQIVVPTRVFDKRVERSTHYHNRWHSKQPELIRFEYTSA